MSAYSPYCSSPRWARCCAAKSPPPSESGSPPASGSPPPPCRKLVARDLQHLRHDAPRTKRQRNQQTRIAEVTLQCRAVLVQLQPDVGCRGVVADVLHVLLDRYQRPSLQIVEPSVLHQCLDSFMGPGALLHLVVDDALRRAEGLQKKSYICKYE